MPMKITGQASSQYTNASSNTKTQVVNDAEIKTQNSTNKDHVNISDSARLLINLTRQIASLPVVDDMRVEEIKTKINSSDYSTDYLLVAERLIINEQAMH